MIFIYILYVQFADKPNEAPSNVIIIEKTSESLYVQWEEVLDIFSINYTVKWSGSDSSDTHIVNELSYNVTGLTPNTVYTITVAAINTCCGEGPESDPIMNMTDMGPINPGNVIHVITYLHKIMMYFLFQKLAHSVNHNC